MKNIHLLLLTFIICLLGCKKNTDINQTPFNIYCDINGVHRTFTYWGLITTTINYYNYDSNGCYITAIRSKDNNGTSSNDELKLFVNTFGAKARTGVRYPLKRPADMSVYIRDNNNGNYGLWYNADTATSYVTFSYLDSIDAAGSFELHGMNDSNQTVDIVNGHFHVSISR